MTVWVLNGGWPWACLSHYITTARRGNTRNMFSCRDSKPDALEKKQTKASTCGSPHSEVLSCPETAAIKSCGVNISVSSTSIDHCHGNSIAPLARQRKRVAGWGLTRWIITGLISFTFSKLRNASLCRSNLADLWPTSANLQHGKIWFRIRPTAKLLSPQYVLKE